jgi:hypothetical protein
MINKILNNITNLSIICNNLDEELIIDIYFLKLTKNDGFDLSEY